MAGVVVVVFFQNRTNLRLLEFVILGWFFLTGIFSDTAKFIGKFKKQKLD